jgi:uncharacterized protein YkwD
MGWGHRLVSRLGFGTGAVATTVVIVGGLAIVHGNVNVGALAGSNGSTVAAVDPTLPQPPTTADAGTVGNDTTGETAAPGETTVDDAVTTTGAPTASASSSARHSTPASRSGSTRATIASGAPANSSTTPTADLAEQVLDQINLARTSAGLPALVMSPALIKSAAEHNKVMSTGCGLSHQCASESDLGKRITSQGVTWTAAGENIGQGGPEPDDADAIVAMAKQLTADMLAEAAPNDGHKKNILSKSFKHVGISLYRDANGTVWMTQDFAS